MFSVNALVSFAERGKKSYSVLNLFINLFARSLFFFFFFSFFMALDTSGSEEIHNNVLRRELRGLKFQSDQSKVAIEINFL